MLNLIIALGACNKKDNQAHTISGNSEYDTLSHVDTNDLYADDTASVRLDAQIETPVVEDEKDEEILERQLNKSSLVSLGCCSNEKNWKKDCCCEPVMKAYEKLRAQNKYEELAEMKTKDPIFQQCQSLSKWKKKREEIDRLNEEENDDDDYEF